MLHRLLVCSFALAPLAAQIAPPPAAAPLTAKAFLVDDVTNVNCVDFALLRSTGVWDDLAVSALKLAFGQIEKEMGCAFADLERLTAMAQFEEGGGMVAVKQLVVFEGNRDLRVPESVARNPMWSQDEPKEGVEVWRGGGRAQLFVRLPTARIEGDEELIAPVLAGKPWSNRQAPDVMSLLAGKEKNAVYVVVDVAQPMIREGVLGQLLPDMEWPEGDAPTFGCLRIVVTGDADDPHLGVVATLRHGKAAEGVKASQQAAKALLERLSAMPAMRAAKAMLAKTEVAVDGGDLVMKLDLGRSRDAVGTLATLAAPLFARATVDAPVPAEPPPPAAEPKKEEPKKEAVK